MSMEQGRLDWVQALRGIAAMLVVLCHALDYLSHSPSFPLIESALLPGAMGVDLFFIISGFIMVYSTRKTTGTLDDVKNFAINRFSRIWPTYAVVSIIWIFIAYDGINYFISYENWAVLFKSLTFIPVKEMAPLYFEPVFPLSVCSFTALQAVSSCSNVDLDSLYSNTNPYVNAYVFHQPIHVLQLRIKLLQPDDKPDHLGICGRGSDRLFVPIAACSNCQQIISPKFSCIEHSSSGLV